MTLVELQDQMKDSMKNKDKIKTTLIKEIIGEAKNIAINDKRKEPSEEDITRAITKIHKVCKEQVDTCPEDRDDKMQEYGTRLLIISDLMPKLMSRNEVWARITELTTDKEFKNVGEIMKLVMPELKGKADGKLISEVAKEFISK
jgi:uncharacterized protein YqeY